MKKTICLDTKLNKIDNIYHISDIHIRKRSRHVEYRRVFQRLEKFINTDKEDDNDFLIVITGDIMHDKSEMVPESVNMLKKFLLRLSNITELVVIIGNHDINIFNDKSMDCLTPIIADLKTKHPIHLLSKSAVYELNNIYFGHTKMFNKKVLDIKKYSLKKLYHDKSEMKIIGLYHGMLHGCNLDNGMTIYTNNSNFNCGDFKDYDIVMLGDVHKHQYLNKNKTIAYAGSLIQQKRDEDLLEHGVIKWNMKNNTSQFHRISNDFGMMELLVPVNKSVLKKTLKKLHSSYNNSELPKKLDIKLIYDKIGAKDNFNKIYDVFTKELNIKIVRTIETISNKFDKKLQNNINFDNKNKTQKIIINSNKSVIDVMMKHIKNNMENMKDNKTNKLIETKIKNILQEINYNYEQDSKKITLKTIKFNNMFIYLNNNTVNFERFTNIVGLNASNFQGKSSFIDIILYSIYGKCSRGKRYDVMNINKKHMNSEIILKCNNDEIKIIRNSVIASNNLRTLNEKVDVYFNDELINGDDRIKTNQIIEKKICSYDDMLNNSFVLQKNGKSFIELDDRKKKDLLCKIAKLDIFDKIFVLTKSKHYSAAQSLGKTIKKIEEYKKYDSSKSVSKLKADNIQKFITSVGNNFMTLVKNNQDELQKMINKKNNIKNELKTNTKEIHNNEKYNMEININKIEKEHHKKYKEKIVTFNEEITNILNNMKNNFQNMNNDEFQNKKEFLKTLHTKLKYVDKTTNIHKINNLITNNNQKLLSMKKENSVMLDQKIKISKYICKNLLIENKYNNYVIMKNSVENNKNIISNKINNILKNIKNNEEDLDELKNYIFDDNCEACRNNPINKNIKSFQKILFNNKKLLKEYQKELEENDKKQEEINNSDIQKKYFNNNNKFRIRNRKINT